MKLRTLLLRLAPFAIAACAPAKSPSASLSDLADPVARAFREEATGDPTKATNLYLEALEKAAKAGGDAYQTEAVIASLDALVFRTLGAFDDITNDSALAFRQTEVDVAKELARIFGKAEGPFAKALIAEAVERIARHRGDHDSANRFHAARGCVRDSLVFGPIAPGGIETVHQSSGLEKEGAKIPDALVTSLPFSPRAVGFRTFSRGCAIPLYGPSAALGVREVVVDVEIPSDQTIGVSLSASSEARLATNGTVVLTRPHRLGNAGVTRFARITAKKGFLRLTARVAMDAEQETIEIGAWSEHGEPLRARAPSIGSSASSAGARVQPFPASPLVREQDRLLVALSHLATGEERIAEDALYPEFTSASPSPALLLAYARALNSANDLSKAQVGERKRSAYDRILTAWPSAWEAIVEHAVAAGERRASTEARMEALKDLAEHRGSAKASLPTVVDLFEATTAYAEGLNDRSKVAYEKAEKADKSPLFYEVGRLAINRVGADYLNYACAAHQNKDAVHCHDAFFMQGKWSEAEKEIERLRALRSSPNDFLSRSAMSAFERGDAAGADAFVAKMLPGERALWFFGVRPTIDKTEIIKRAKTSPDSPWAIPPLLRAAGDDPAAAFAGVAEKITALDRKVPIMPSAATAVLVHREKYDLNAEGLLHYVLFDVRRVSGTTDVDQHAQADAPDLLGRESIRIVRKRIFKKDGRILSPDRAPNAAQGHADLAQLEAGDSVEAIYEGWALPTAAGTIGFDTPDALPARTGVHDFELSISLPSNAKEGAFHAHPLLGKATSTEAGGRVTHLYKWTDQAPRRIEDGMPKMDAAVSVSFSTATWAEFGRGIRDAKIAMDDAAPEVTRWAKDAVSTESAKKGDRAIVEALVRAVGESVKEASTGELIDVESGLPTQTARASLASHEGSRTWLLARALREFGISSEIVVAENDPFSADPNFPPHFGRFLHPLLIAHAKSSDKKAEDIWIDADIAGPPLPPGRISPELRGRNAIHEDGSITPLPVFESGETKDEIDLRVTVDERGDAKGQVTVLLRGRSAQSLSGVLERIVGEERQRVLRGVALAWVPFANVDTVQLSSSEGSWQVAIRAELSIPGFAQVEGTKVRSWVVQGVDPIHAVFPRPYVATLGATYASKKGRESALAVNEASQYHLRRRIALPKGSTLAKLPGPFEVDSPLLRASRKIAVNGETIEEDFSLTLSTGTIGKDAYNAFTESAHRVDDAFLASMRIAPPAPAAK